jgi:hypothetical protein
MFGELQGTSQLALMRKATIGGRKKHHHAPTSQRLLIKLPKQHKRLGRKIYGVSND